MNSIFEFAVVTEWESRLQVLAQTAEPERWSYLHVPGRVRLQILDNYIRHTFSRALDQGKDAYRSDRVPCFGRVLDGTR